MKPTGPEDPYSDPCRYDAYSKYHVEDVAFFLQQAKRYGQPVLELACGTGRITIPLARTGIAVTGLDVSAAMLAHARAKAGRIGANVEWVQADCRDFELNRRFNLVFIPFNSLLHLHDLESIEACLSPVKQHLSDEGRFIIDVFNPRLDMLLRDPSGRYPALEYDDPDGRGKVVVTESNVYDPATQINRIKWYFKVGDSDEEFVMEINLRILYPQELDALLHYNGFEIETQYGNYDGSPFESLSPKKIVVCRVKQMSASDIRRRRRPR